MQFTQPMKVAKDNKVEEGSTSSGFHTKALAAQASSTTKSLHIICDAYILIFIPSTHIYYFGFQLIALLGSGSISKGV